MILPFQRRRPDAPARTRATISRPRKAITAAAVPATRETATSLRRLNQPWQALALARYDDVGECWYPAQFYSRTMQKVRFFAGFRDEKGDIQEEENGPLAELWRRVQDPGGGITELTGSYGHLMFLTGDGYLVTSESDGEEVWEFLSPVELRVNPDGGNASAISYRRLRAPGLTLEELFEAPDDAFELMTGEVRVSRLYRRHPSYSFWADSPVRSVLDQYELLKMLTLAALAEAQSRAANRGMLIVPDDWSFTNPDAAAGEEDLRQDTLYSDMIDGILHRIENPGDASAMAPHIIRVPGTTPTGVGTQVPSAELIKWISLGPEDSYRALEAAEKVIVRIGNGLDLPGQIVTGETRNHWGDWLVDEQGFRQHVAPICDKFGSDMTAAYLRPAARDAGISGWESVGIGYDPAEAVSHPDEFATAKDLHEAIVISDDAFRESGGFTDEDAPDEEEYERRVAISLGTNPFAEPVEPEAETAPQDGGTGNDVAEMPPTEPNEDPARTAAALSAARILGASESHITRARSLAGSRIRTRSRDCETCQERMNGIAASAVAATLGADAVRQIIADRTTEAALVAGAGGELAETLRRLGVRGDWPDQLGGLVEQHSLRTLYELDAPPLPAGFSAVVAKAIAA